MRVPGARQMSPSEAAFCPRYVLTDLLGARRRPFRIICLRIGRINTAALGPTF
jgi:hypothetical protein